jgi:hypothetical protein
MDIFVKSLLKTGSSIEQKAKLKASSVIREIWSKIKILKSPLEVWR